MCNKLKEFKFDNSYETLTQTVQLDILSTSFIACTSKEC